MSLLKTRRNFCRLLAFVYYLILGFQTVTVMAVTEEEVEHGEDMLYRAVDAICYYEIGIKIPPPEDIKVVQDCMLFLEGRAELSKLEEYRQMPPDFKVAIRSFGLQGEEGPLSLLPKDYMESCQKFAADPSSKAETDESATLVDGGKDYPFKSLTYCLMHHLRIKCGDETVEKVKKIRITGKGDWRQSTLDKDNGFRARHGSTPFELEEELNSGAQKWAEQMAQECKMYHSTYEERESSLDKGSGENIAMWWTRSIDSEKTWTLLTASNSWYSEIVNYTYPDDFVSMTESVPPGSELGPGPRQTGHFTQTVWDSTKKVGYGSACNPSCGSFVACFSVGRYYPAGNIVGRGMFKDNVKRPLY